MNKNVWNICLKWGAILGGLLSLLELIKMFARNVQFGSTQMFDLAMIILYILLLYWGGKEFKEHYPNRLSFGKAFLCGVLISLIGAAILFCYTLVHYSYIEKDGLQKKYVSALQNYKETILNDTITAAELTQYLDTIQEVMTAQETMVCAQDSVDTALLTDIHHGTALLNKYYTEKMSRRPSLDTALHYQLRNFTGFSRETMMNTLSAYIDQNQKETSTPFIRMIVENTNTMMDDFDPGEARYQQQKNRVPHYDKITTLASVNAALQLMYGMFFSIFVALYLYRSKHPLEPTEEPTQEVVEEEIIVEETTEETENPSSPDADTSEQISKNENKPD